MWMRAYRGTPIYTILSKKYLKREEEMNEVRKKYKKLKEKKQSQQKSIEEAKVRINDLSVASLFQRFYPQMHRIEISRNIITN